MNQRKNVRGARALTGSVLSLIGMTSFLAACSGGADGAPPAGGETSDEYTEPLTQAIVGSPTGTVAIDKDGNATPVKPPPPPPPSDGGIGAPPGDDDGGAEDAGSPTDAGTVTGDGGGGPGSASGLWHFDDCSPKSTFMADSSGNGDSAQHALKSSCVPGISNLGVQIRGVKDLVQVPDQPQFTVTTNVSVAAWVNPKTVTGDRPIVVKRLNDKTSFSLGIHNKNIEMSVVLKGGTTVISRAPIPAGVWSHVAGMFDGTFVYLFLNGQQFGQVYAAGTVRDVLAPIRVGATTQSQAFDGVIDEVFVSTEPMSKDALTALSCIHRPSTFAVNPKTGGPVPFDTPVHYDVTVSNNDVGLCQPATYEVFGSSGDPSVSVAFDSSFQNVPEGSSAVFGATVSATEDATPGVSLIPFTVLEFNTAIFEQLQGQLSFELSPPSGCFVSTRRELMITGTSVVDDPVRAPSSGGSFGDAGTVLVPPGGAAAGSASAGVWSFGALMRELAPTPAAAPAMVERLFKTWLSDQLVNGFTVSARPAIQASLLDLWPRTADGALDLDRSPLRLQAIVNRPDLRNVGAGSAGEGRFVFGVNDGGGNPQQFTLILEYNLPAATAADSLAWASAWHALATHPFPSEEYNAALEALTRKFAGRGASATGVNGSALINLRTNENVLSPNGRWELREFGLSAATGLLEEVTVKETPDLGFNGTQTFADFVNENAAAIIEQVPGAMGATAASFQGKPFLGGSVFNDLIAWSAPGIASSDARFHASLNTCNGCHGPESNTTFLMVTPRFPGNEATLSPFLTGTTVFDSSGTFRTLNDLARRRADLTSIVCGGADAGAPPGPFDAGAFDGGSPIFIDGGGSGGLDASSGSSGRLDASVPPPFLGDAGAITLN